MEFVCMNISEKNTKSKFEESNSQSDISNFLIMSFTAEDVEDGGGIDGSFTLEGAELSRLGNGAVVEAGSLAVGCGREGELED